MEPERTKILVVDDEPAIAQTLKRFLTNKGYDVTTAPSGEEALNALDREKIDLVLLDIMLPGIKGTEVVRIIKEKYPSIKIIIVTGYPQESESISKNNKLEGVFIKPVKTGDLYDKLLKTLNPQETEVSGADDKKAIRARVILIKAKILFIESSAEVYSFLRDYFKGLSNKGEDYEIDVVTNEDDIAGKIGSFVPDILAVNAVYFKQAEEDWFSKIKEKGLYPHPREIISYNIINADNVERPDLEILAKAIESICFKNGLIEIKWIDI